MVTTPLDGLILRLQAAVLGFRYHRRKTIGSLAYLAHKKVLRILACWVRVLCPHARRVGDDYVEVEVFLAGYVQAVWEVRLEREEWERWIRRWEKAHNSQLRHGRRSRQRYCFRVSTLVSSVVIIEPEIQFNFQTTAAAQPRAAVWIFDPFSCFEAVCAQYIAYKKLFLGIDPRLLEIESKSIIFIPASSTALLHLSLVVIDHQPQSSQLYHRFIHDSERKFEHGYGAPADAPFSQTWWIR